jgi:hypothetical protein
MRGMRPRWVAIAAGTFAAGLLTIVGGLVAFCLLYGTQRIGIGVSGTGLASLRIGMDGRDVLRLLGPPLAQVEREHNEVNLVYAEPCRPCGNGLEISVRLKDERVEAAGAEFWDLGVWWCRRDACPIIWDPGTFDLVLDSSEPAGLPNPRLE